MRNFYLTALLVFVFSYQEVQAQCGVGVPQFTVNLTGNPGGSWTSPSIARSGNCCSTTAPNTCVEFIITLDPAAVGVNFNIIAGAIPGGSLFYQINCGPPTPLGSPICLNGPGPFILTFCKPGNNSNVYQITSIPAPTAGRDTIVDNGCSVTLNALGFNPSTVTWNSIFPGAPGAYNSYLSCATGCTNPTVTPTGTPPPYVEYVICGNVNNPCITTPQCDTIKVTFNPTLIATIVPINPTICFGQTSTNITVNGSGGTPPYHYLWSTGSTSQTISVGAGNYSVLLYDNTNCPPVTAVVTVTQFTAAIAAHAGPDQTLCSQNPIATLNASVTGASGGIWSGGAGTFSPNNTTLTNVTYTPTATEVANGSATLYLTTTGNGTCPPSTDTIVIHYHPFLGTISITPHEVSCFGGNNGSATANVTGGSSPFNYTWNTVPSQITQTANTLSAGTYSVTIHDGIGCTASASVTITQPPLLVLNPSSTNVGCSGGSNGTASVIASGGSGHYTYSWNPGNQTTSSVTGLASGNYTVTVHDSLGCVATTTVAITQPAPLAVTLATTNVSCNGGSNGSSVPTVTGGTAAYTYSWTPGNITAATLSGVSVGTYTLVVTDAHGCTASATTTITQPPVLTATISSNNVTCSYLTNGSATANVTGGTSGYTYSWHPGAMTTATVSGLASGSYTVTVTDANGCTTQAFTTITAPPAIVISFMNQTNVSCFGGSNGSVTTSASGGSPGYAYSWSPISSSSTTINNIAAGTYTVTVTDNNGCTAQNTVTITQPAAPLSVIVTSTPVSCYGGSNGTLSSTGFGGTGPYTYSWTPGNYTGQNVTNVPAGFYVVTVTDSKGCVSSNSVNVSQPGAISPTVTTVNSTCGMANGQASATVTGGVGPYTYTWSPTGGNASTATGLFSGAYSLTVVDAHGCSVVVSVIINDNTGPTASIFSTTNVSCFGGSNGSATVGVSGGTGPFTYSWSPSGGNGPTATGLSAGTYTITVIDANGCQSFATTSPSITQPPPITISVNTTPTNCFGGSNGFASASASGGTPGYSYSWMPIGGTGSAHAGLPAGTYTVQATDTNGCVQTQTFTISQPTPVTATISGTANVSCFGGSNGIATVTAGGGTPFYTYTWTPTGGNGASATGLAAGTYTVTVTDSKGCTASTTVTITQPVSALSASGVSTSVSCFGGSDGSATINTSGGTPNYTYSWSPSGGPGQTSTNLSAGLYFVHVNDANGCSVNTSVFVTQPSQISGILVFTNPSCGNNNGVISSQISGGVAPYTYLWTPGNMTTASVSGLSPGTYTLTVTDSHGCTRNFSTTITNVPGPSVSISAHTNVSCFGGANGTATISISQGTAPFAINWSPAGGTALTASSLTAGTYTATVIDALGCVGTAVITLTQPPPLSVSVSSLANVSCFGGSNGSAIVAVGGGTPAYNYSWSPNTSFTSTATSLTAGTYSVTITDQLNCTTSVSLNITQPPALTSAIISSVSPSCSNSSNGSATVSASGGTVAYTYSWSTVPSQTGTTASNLAAGTYTITVTDSHGCTASSTTTLSQPTPVVTTVTPNDTICPGAHAIFTANATGGSGNYYYAWNPPGTVTSGTLNIVPGSNTTYTVVGYDQNGCPSSPVTTSVFLYSLGPANLAVYGNSPICPGTSTVIYAQTTGAVGTLMYTWNNNLGSGPGAFLVTPAVPTTYVVTVTNSCGASVVDSVHIAFNPPPTVLVSVDTASGCAPVTIQFTDHSISGNSNDPITSWYWNFGDNQTSSQQNPSHTYTVAGTYTVTLGVGTFGGCANSNASTPIVINVHPVPTALFSVNSVSLNLPYDILSCHNQSVGATTYSWSFGDGGTSVLTNPKHTYTTVGTYPVTLIATSQYGCSDTSRIDITASADFVFPNAFTPTGNSDGYYDITSLNNDIFFPYTSGVVDYKLSIFNRWGELIFETNDIKQGWDGYYHGKACQQDVYVWKAYAKLNSGKTFNLTGDVTLLR